MRTIKPTANHRKLTFTLRVCYSNGWKRKYRTYPMKREDFDAALNYVYSDWSHYLGYGEYKEVN